mgnify:CR=1 FL=1
MIQRIQTLYMFLAVVAMAACFMFPVVSFDTTNDTGTLSGEMRLLPRDNSVHGEVMNVAVSLPQQSYINTWWLVALVALAAVVTIVCVFMYRNRIRQMRLVMIPFLLMVAYLFLVFIWAADAFVDKATLPLTTPGEMMDVHVVYGIGTWAAAVALLFLFLANRAIKSDEAKVRAADRLR